MNGHLSVGYTDDSYLHGGNFALCVQNIVDTLMLFNSLGFVVHPEKSVSYPTQSLAFLGFVLDSLPMKISPTTQKTEKVKMACQQFLMSSPSIRQVAGSKSVKQGGPARNPSNAISQNC